MAKSEPAHTRPNNRLLALLAESDYQQLRPHLEPVDLPVKKMLYQSREVIDNVYFPTGGVSSAVTYVENGTPIEVATVGNEGLVGALALLGEVSSPNEVYMQVEGRGLRVTAKQLRRSAGVGTSLYDIIVKYLNAYSFQVSQTAACNALHVVQQRCCRWLLMTLDRVQSSQINLTHEFLSIMLGVRRASITEVLAPLQEAGLVVSTRGVINVIDRTGLEAKSCECYQAVRDEFERLLTGPKDR